MILEIVSEVISQPLSNSSLDVSHPSLVISHGASQASKLSKAKPRFTEYACSHFEVSLAGDFVAFLQSTSLRS